MLHGTEVEKKRKQLNSILLNRIPCFGLGYAILVFKIDFKRHILVKYTNKLMFIYFHNNLCILLRYIFEIVRELRMV